MTEPKTLAPTDDDLRYQALVNYGAYTSFRVEEGGVRGLDLHLSRLGVSAVELFGVPVGDDRLRDLIRTAVADRRDAWLRVSLFAPDIVPRHPSAEVRPKVMTSVSPAPPPLATSVRAQVSSNRREWRERHSTSSLASSARIPAVTLTSCRVRA